MVQFARQIANMKNILGRWIMTKYNVNQNHLKFIKYLEGASDGYYTTILNGITIIQDN